MKMTAYKRLLSKHTPEALEQILYIADTLELQCKDKLTIAEKEVARTKLRMLTVASERIQEILDLMQYDWEIFNGQHHRLTPRDNPPLTSALINTDNLKNLIRALNTLLEQYNPSTIKFSFEKHILAYQNRKKGVIIGERGTYREGLLQALTHPHLGVIKDVEAVIETISAYKRLPTLDTLVQQKAFFKTQMGELQSALKAVRLGGIITLKWSNGNRTISLVANP